VPDDRYGAYGLHLPHITRSDYLVAAPPEWPTWQVTHSSDPYDGPQLWGPDEAALDTQPVGRAFVDRAAATTRLHLPEPPSQQALIHPHLGVTAVATAAWRGDFTLHAGSFVLDGGVWGLMGDRERGKSSALAWMASHDIPIFADDLLVTDGITAKAGPRCIDLRESAAQRFGIGEYVGVLGTRERWRVRLPAVEAEVPFRGWVLLDWADDIAVTSLPLEERVSWLSANRGLKLPAGDSVSGMRVVAAPAYRFTRPADWGRIDEAMELLLKQLSTT